MLLFEDFREYSEFIRVFEGGNSHAKDPDGNIIAYAEKIDLSTFDRKTMVEDLLEMFRWMNSNFESEFGDKIWRDFSILESGHAFNGSSEQFFDLTISDDEYFEYKPKVGDVDLTVPKEKLGGIWKFLNDHQGEMFTSNVRYLGHNKSMEKWGNEHQINAVFQYFDDDGNHVNFQVDFEGTDYKENFKPSSFAKFAHSSAWEDMKEGFKGVNHKFLLRNMVRASSALTEAILLTPKSPEDDPDNVKISTRSFKENFMPRMLAFSVDRGLREKFRIVTLPNGEPMKIDGKMVYKEIPTRDSDYTKDIKVIFSMVFNREPDERDLRKFWSFTGLVELMRKYFDRDKVELTFEYLVKQELFGRGAQGLERDNPSLDFKIKWGMVDYLFEHFNFLKSQEDDVKAMADKYYENYKKTKISEI